MNNYYNPFRIKKFQQGGVLPWQIGYKAPLSPINTSYDRMVDQANQARMAAAQRQKARVAALEPYDPTKPQWLNDLHSDPTPWNKKDNRHAHEHLSPTDVRGSKTKQPYITSKQWTPEMKKVAEWQRRLGITVDGIWGKQTQRAYEAYQRNNHSVAPEQLNMNYASSMPKAYSVEAPRGTVASFTFSPELHGYADVPNLRETIIGG